MFNNRGLVQNGSYDNKSNLKSTPIKMANSSDQKFSENINKFEKLNDKLNNFIDKSSDNNQNIQSQLSDILFQIQNYAIEKEELKSEILFLKNKFEHLNDKYKNVNQCEVEINRLSIESMRNSEDINAMKNSIKETIVKCDNEVIEFVAKAVSSVRIPIEEKIQKMSESIVLMFNKRSKNLDEIMNNMTINDGISTTQMNFVKNKSCDDSSQGFEVDDDSQSEESEFSGEDNSEDINLDEVEIPKFENVCNIKEEKVNTSLFRSNIGTTNVNEAPKSFFDNAQRGEKSQPMALFGTPTQIKPSLFGNRQSEEKSQPMSLFGAPIQTKATLFGSSQNAEKSDKKESVSLFGNSLNVEKSDKKENVSIFGNSNQVKPTFGISKLENTTDIKTKPLFGSNQVQKETDIQVKSLFSNAEVENKTINQSKSIFGNAEMEKKIEVQVKPNLFGNPISEGKSTLFGNVENKPNVKNEVKPSIFSSLKLGDGSSKSETNKDLFSTKSGSLFNFGSKTVTTEEAKPVFGSKTVTTEEVKPVFGSKTFTTEEAKPVFGSNANIQTFDSYAAKNKEKEFGIVTETNWQAGPKLFSSVKPKEEGDSVKEDNEEVEENDPDFKPIIELPPLVQIVKDEDEKETLFRSRCKLYNFDNEWKERGIGELKIFKNVNDGAVTLIMRREQVHKLCCNQLVSKDSHKFAPMSEKSVCWPGVDFSDGNNKTVKFAVKFADKAILEDFKRIIQEVQSNM